VRGGLPGLLRRCESERTQEGRWDQILRFGLTLLNHQNRITPTTMTNKIVSFIGLASVAELLT
jgi:hypothetical protein